MKITENKYFIRLIEWILIFSVLIILVLLTTSIPVKADYNITSKYQKTEFNSTKWIQSYHNITLNTTKGIITLNQSTSARVYEDFTTFTEKGVVATMSQNATRSTFTNFDRTDSDTLCYKLLPNRDEGFEIIFELKITSVVNSATTIRMNILGWLEDDEDFLKIKADNEEQFGIQMRSLSTTTTFYLPLYETKDGAQYYTGTSGNLNVGTLYYCKFIRSGTSIKLYVDDDSDFSSCVAGYNPKSATLHGNYDYCNYLAMPQSVDYAGSIVSSGYVQNLWFGNTTGGYMTEGVLYTKDLLENTTEKSVMIGINGSAVTNTVIRLYTSGDNSTWTWRITNNGLGERALYYETLYDYSIMYVRVNLTTTDDTITPYLDELFYLHTFSGGGVCPPSNNNEWFTGIIFICVPPLILLIYFIMRKR